MPSTPGTSVALCWRKATRSGTGPILPGGRGAGQDGHRTRASGAAVRREPSAVSRTPASARGCPSASSGHSSRASFTYRLASCREKAKASPISAASIPLSTATATRASRKRCRDASNSAIASLTVRRAHPPPRGPSAPATGRPGHLHAALVAGHVIDQDLLQAERGVTPGGHGVAHFALVRSVPASAVRPRPCAPPRRPGRAADPGQLLGDHSSKPSATDPSDSRRRPWGSRWDCR